MRSVREVWRFWPWSSATVAGGGVAGFFLLLWLSDGARTAGGFVAAVMNGIALFFIVGGIFAVIGAADQGSDSLANHPWRFASVPAAAALVMLLALRLTALALRLDGPWRTVPDSLLDVGGRSLVVFAIVGSVAAWRRPVAPGHRDHPASGPDPDAISGGEPGSPRQAGGGAG